MKDNLEFDDYGVFPLFEESGNENPPWSEEDQRDLIREAKQLSDRIKIVLIEPEESETKEVA